MHGQSLDCRRRWAVHICYQAVCLYVLPAGCFDVVGGQRGVLPTKGPCENHSSPSMATLCRPLLSDPLVGAVSGRGPRPMTPGHTDAHGSLDPPNSTMLWDGPSQQFPVSCWCCFCCKSGALGSVMVTPILVAGLAPGKGGAAADPAVHQRPPPDQPCQRRCHLL